MALKLKDNKIFEWISGSFLNLIVDNSKRVNVSNQEIIITQWDTSDNHAYVIQKWEVSVIIDNKEVKKLWEWDIFWEIALITNEPRTATIKANDDCILLQINKIILEKVIKELKNWKEIQKVIFERIMENNKR